MSTVYPCAGRWKVFDVEDRRGTAVAKSLCEGCPILEACLLKALRLELRAPVNMRQGVWGGTSREQRHLIATKGIGHPDAHRLRHEALGVDPADCEQCAIVRLPVAA